MVTLKIGVLALQGAFREHVQILRSLGVNALEVRKPEHLADLDGLIMPGGESTSMALIAERWGMIEPLRQWVHGGKPTWGTCAGMILLADAATGQKQGGQALIGGLHVTVNRNYFGRQVDSFEAELNVTGFEDGPFHAIFIRAPAITDTADDVAVLATVQPDAEHAAVVVAACQGPILATAFHPELTHDYRWHQLFIEITRANKVQ